MLPCRNIFFEDLEDAFGSRLELCRFIKLCIEDSFVRRTKPWLADPQHADKFYDIIVDLIRGLAKSGTTTLVFVQA